MNFKLNGKTGAIGYNMIKREECSWCQNVHNSEQGRPTGKGFISGSKNYRPSTVTDHEKSTGHIKSSQVMESRRAAERELLTKR